MLEEFFNGFDATINILIENPQNVYYESRTGCIGLFTFIGAFYDLELMFIILEEWLEKRRSMMLFRDRMGGFHVI